ncbi:DUF4097 family beta strand repeat-containing protein [Haloarcula japonica]|uniref:DUF4097 family beta strand repeat-containing protein n=1 Tax=Haloarcula japonica TaxID=29282 RepID=UPI000B14F465|nr:DUF4097 family beta strand repeat-containing protein [Haloarcula japonica]
MLVTAWLVVTAGAGAGVTYGLLSDDATASGTIRIDVGSSAPPNGDAYNDANGNGRYDEGETTYAADELASFYDPSANLVIPETVESIEQDQVGITAGSITYSGKVESESVSLTAKSGDISVNGAEVESEGSVQLSAPNGGVSMTDGTVESESVSVTAKDGDVSMDGTTVESEGSVQLSAPNNGISIIGASVESESISVTAKGEDILADRATLNSEGAVQLKAPNDGISIVNGLIESESVSLTAKGGCITVDGTAVNAEGDIVLRAPNDPISMTGAELSADGSVTLRSNGDIHANDSSMESGNGAITADLGTTDATLYVDGATIDDGDDAIAYRPNGVRVVPSDGPATGP